jgi:hypothetical protein
MNQVKLNVEFLMNTPPAISYKGFGFYLNRVKKVIEVNKISINAIQEIIYNE